MLPWGMGLLILTLVPVLSSIVAGIAMIVSGRMQRANGPLAEENGRRAANWGLTYLIATVLLMGAHFTILIAFQDNIPDGFFPMGIFVTLWAAISLVHIIVSIVGLVAAHSMKVVKWNGIPFFRGRRESRPRPH